MPSHKFRVGQMVGLNLASQDAQSGLTRDYKILQLLPFTRGEFTYRIKTITEASERVATEAQLVLRTPFCLRAIS